MNSSYNTSDFLYLLYVTADPIVEMLSEMYGLGTFC